MYRRKRSQQERKSKQKKRTEKNGMLSLRTGRYFCYKKDQNTAHLLWCAVFCFSYDGGSLRICKDHCTLCVKVL